MAWKSRAAASLSLMLPVAAALAQPLAPPLGTAPGTAQQGTPLAPPPPLSGSSWIVAQTAELALLDKVTARTSMVSVPVGGQTEFGTLTISVARCMRRPPEEPAEAAAWITAADARAGQGAAPSFRGWMFATSPALNPLQHPVYDVRVIACK
jgi:hypothetical protein